MKHIIYSSISEATFSTIAHQQVIDDFIHEYERTSAVVPTMVHSGKANLELTEFSYEDLSDIHFHYSHKNNGKSIEKTGLIARIGENSAEIDEEKAIYFSVGAEAVLHNWDVWLKWRLNRFCNPRAAGVKCATKLNEEHGAEVWKISVNWMKYMASRKYREDETILNQVFEYERIELSRSDYHALSIAPGVNYPKEQFDMKKAFIVGSAYAEEIYGVGVSTDLSNEFAEQWNRSTELGKDATITPDNVWRLTAEGKNDALSILSYLYRRYLKQCKFLRKEPADFALLPKFLEYCEKI